MDIQAYRVAVRIALDDQISRQMMQVSRDALELNKTFVQMAKNIKAVTSAAKEATTAFSAMNKVMSNQFSRATRDANGYSTAMRSVSEQAIKAKDSIKNLPAVSSSGALPYLALGAAAGVTSSGGGRNYGGGGGGYMGLPSPGGGMSSGWNGWKNGVPPGGWDGGGQPPGGGSDGQNAYPGGGSHSNGMTNLATGYFGFKLLDGFVDEAAKYQTISEKFNQFKIGDAALKDAQKYAEAQKIKGTSDSEMLMLMVEAQGVFRQPHSLDAAKLAAPIMAKLGYASRGLDQNQREATEAKQMDMLRFVETAGGLKSPQRFNELMDAGFKAIQSSGGNVDFTQYRQFMAKAGTSAFNLSNKALFAELEPIIGELKGSAAGDALMTSYNRLNGIVKLPNQVTRDLMNMGVWDKDKIELNKMGGIKRFMGNPLINSKLFSESPVDYYKQMILPIYQKQNLSEDQIQRENALIFGRTGGKMFNLIDKQMQTIEHSVAMFNQSRGLNESYNSVGGTYNGKKIDFEKKWENLQLVMGKDGGLLDTFTKGLNALSTTLQRMTDLAHKYPDLAKFVGQAALAVTGLAALSGGIWILKHAAGGLIGPLKIVGWGINALIGTNTTGLMGLSAGLLGLPALITGVLTAFTAFSAYKVYQWYKDGMSKDPTFQAGASEASKGASRFNVTNPNALDDYRHLLNPNKYPKVPPKQTSQTQDMPANLIMTHEGQKVIVATVISGMTKQATKAPSGPSAFDSSNLMTYPGQVSAASTN